MSKSDLVLNGILPVDQLRDWWSPVSLLADRVPRDVIERFYGINLPVPNFEEDPNRNPTASEILSSYALARGFMTSNIGNPDQARASRTILKDYNAGKLLFCHAPPSVSQEEYSKFTLERLRTNLPVRYKPKPYKPIVEGDEHLAAASVGYFAKKPNESAKFNSSKKHYKGHRGK